MRERIKKESFVWAAYNIFSLRIQNIMSDYCTFNVKPVLQVKIWEIIYGNSSNTIICTKREIFKYHNGEMDCEGNKISRNGKSELSAQGFLYDKGFIK